MSHDFDHAADLLPDPIDELERQVAAAGVAPAPVRDEADLLILPEDALGLEDEEALDEEPATDDDAIAGVAQALGVPRFATEADDLARVLVSEETRALMTPEVTARLLALLEARREAIDRQLAEALAAAERDAFFARWPSHLERRRAEIDRRIDQLRASA